MSQKMLARNDYHVSYAINVKYLQYITFATFVHLKYLPQKLQPVRKHAKSLDFLAKIFVLDICDVNMEKR